jgi:hypothetical protein
MDHAIQQYFKRYEVKYMLNEAQYQEFRERTSHLLMEDDYGESDICNCYYDTPDDRLIRNSMEKGIYKEKLRLRSYGVPQDASARTYLELKKKYQGIVYKRREELTYGQAQQVLSEYVENPFAQAGLDSQIFREIAWVWRYYEKLYPAMYLSYRRIAMYEQSDIENQGLRITFDRDLLWRTEDVDLAAGIYGDTLLEPGYRIMEVKSPGAMPMWFVRLLDDMKLYPTSYSKYGSAYARKQHLKQSA